MNKDEIIAELNKCHKQYKIECNKIIKAKNDLISLQESEITKRKEVMELNKKLIAKLYAVILFLALHPIKYVYGIKSCEIFEPYDVLFKNSPINILLFLSRFCYFSKITFLEVLLFRPENWSRRGILCLLLSDQSPQRPFGDLSYQRNNNFAI